MQQEVEVGADRAALSERFALWCRQRKEQVPIALREAWEAPEKLVLFRREDLKAVALRHGIAGGIIGEGLGVSWRSGCVVGLPVAPTPSRSGQLANAPARPAPGPRPRPDAPTPWARNPGFLT